MLRYELLPSFCSELGSRARSFCEGCDGCEQISGYPAGCHRSVLSNEFQDVHDWRRYKVALLANAGKRYHEMVVRCSCKRLAFSCQREGSAHEGNVLHAE
ncbi:uncharacterized protein MYCGRDRAFT_103974 [Zymoseptoria tritici IPO323]|uniref:Uncharacterized protein n=1 Tax=Zymoseptoria tritici (strain CBS 115943 / IPO323) TaxID=336722 RepID=F9X7J6_ZYMTI|nr:uncharacterized protein MYCGRDRAFT_103974 [Zymoseptoria tritici IPO323]EGP89110.1 hypothetical protein MYCGRDRAFT_103974 [Zymoseptoria tritici IPO323]